MRKDYTRDVSDGADEAAFIERYWTEVWKREGGPKDALAKVPRRKEFRIMAPYLARLPKGARLLDGGCGLGQWTAYFTRNGYPTLGLDISRETVEQLQKLFPDVEFAVGDIRDTGLPDKSFDGYFSWGVFEHFEEGFQRCVGEAYRALKPGGYLFVSVPYDNLRVSLKGHIERYSAYPSPASDQRFYQWRLTRAELARELSMGGFEVLEVRPIHKRQGLLRMLHHEFGLDYRWLVTKGLSVVLQPFVPGGLVAHMLMAVGRRSANA